MAKLQNFLFSVLNKNKIWNPVYLGYKLLISQDNRSSKSASIWL